ncbi:hypothetical protein ACS3SW_04140 [Roseobacteraceae bacterium S113]
MTWSEFTTGVTSYATRLRARFPHVDDETLATINDPVAFVQKVAQTHDLTPLEAREEIDDLLFVESLARQASDIRAV